MRDLASNGGLVALMAAAILSGSVCAASPDELKMGGAGAVPILLERLGAACMQGTETKVVVIKGLATSGGIRALTDRALDIAVSGRPLEPEELVKGLTHIASVRTPYVLITSHAKPNGLKGADIADIYGSIKPTWADGTPVRIILRPKTGAEVVAFEQLFPGMSTALEKAYQRRDIPIAATDQANADLAESVPGSLTAASYSQIKMENRNVRLVALDGVEPTIENLERGAYPYARVLHFIAPIEPSPTAERFIVCMRSPLGTQVLRDAGVLLNAD